MLSILDQNYDTQTQYYCGFKILIPLPYQKNHNPQNYLQTSLNCVTDIKLDDNFYK